MTQLEMNVIIPDSEDHALNHTVVTLLFMVQTGVFNNCVQMCSDVDITLGNT